LDRFSFIQTSIYIDQKSGDYFFITQLAAD